MIDTKTFENNMAILDQKYPHIASKVRANDKSPNNYKVLKTKTGEPNILIIRELDHIMLYDNDNPLEYCKKYFDQLNIKFAPIVIFLGFGLGYHLHVFTRFYADKLGTKKIIVFEEDIDLFCMAIKMIDLQPLIAYPDIHLFVGEDPEDASVKIRKEIISVKGVSSFLRSTKVIPLPSNISLNSEYYLEALKKSKRAFRQLMILAGNDPMDSFLGLDNMLMNIKNIVSTPGINLTYNKFKGKPAVIVASGPSLNKNIDLLRDIQQKALIVCCDASFVPLMKRNIRPHIVVTMERTDGTEYFYENVPDLEGIYLAFCPLVKPRTFDSFKGRKIIVNRTFSHFNWLHLDKGSLNVGPSVANMAFTIAEMLGCDPIILIGQDLAFAEDGDTHVKDMIFGERDDHYHKDVMEVEGNDGRPVKTSRAWKIFKLHFEEDISSFEGLCINATEGGAKIRGARIMTFANAIKNFCKHEFDSKSIIDEATSGFDNDIHMELEKFLSHTLDTRKKLKNIIDQFKNAIDDVAVVQREIIHPFLYEGIEMDGKAIEPLIERAVMLNDSYLSDEDIYDIMMHTLQPHVMWFGNKFNLLPEIYSDIDCLRSAQIIMIKEWLGVVGQMLLLTEDSLTRAEEALTYEINRG